jgi:tRNA(Ile)-lysidine synthase
LASASQAPRQDRGSGAQPAVRPLGALHFARMMRALGPFERAPELAVAVSGGSDSLALTLLAAQWAASRGGRVTAITVDHGLRPEAAGEARQVKQWLSRRAIRHVTLRWTGPKPASGLPAAARQARYELLARYCRRHALLHLLLAHQAEDLAETFLIRLGHGSGLVGLAAMSSITEYEGVRLLRPLLGASRAMLRATLRRQGQDWIEDPTNQDMSFERARLRAHLPQLQTLGIRSAQAAATAAALGRARARIEDRVAALFAHVTLEPDGRATAPRRLLLEAPRPLALQALGWLLQTVGGQDYPPRGEALERLLDWIAEGPGRGRTLAGCRIQAAGDQLTVWPEGAPRSGQSGGNRRGSAEMAGITRSRLIRWRPRRPLIPGRFVVV